MANMQGATMQRKSELLARLSEFQQQHLLAFWDDLNADERERLSQQISRIDLAAIRTFYSGSDGAPDWHALAMAAEPPRAIRLSGSNEFSFQAAVAQGESALKAGQVAMILVAGGQGTRLGFPHPKGMFPLGPLSKRTLFQILVDQLLAVRRRYGVKIPLYLMTSPATHDETVAYFRDNRYLGLPAEDVVCFCQGMLPAVDLKTGKILLESRSSIALSPDGHGGMLAALQANGCFEDLQRRNIKLIFYGQVDNPLLQVCDPALLGYHLLAGSEMTTQVVQKRDALEKVGNVVEVNGSTQIIEYSDLPEEAARRKTPSGALHLWAGNIAVHVFDTEFLVRQIAGGHAQPIHRAFKKVPHMDLTGKQIEPSAPNAIKFERFIFDLLPAARNALVVEVDPANAFAPVKNASGDATDTPETAQAAMIHRDQMLLMAAGAVCPSGITVEINPLWALDAAEAAGKLTPGSQVREPTYFGPDSLWLRSPERG
jgi:UDP-N-acetylglucosamine/UDP-N-acetylgalactosamine diphosphorylase